MVALITILLYVFIVTIPFNLVGIFNTLKLVLDVIKIRMGYVKTTILMENGQSTEKMLKPESGSIKIDKKTPIPFSNSLGKVFRKGFMMNTIVRKRDLKQLDLEEPTTASDAQEKKDIGQMLWDDGYKQGYQKAKMMNNLILFVLIGIGIVGLLTFLSYTNTTNILGLLKK
jgi:hypothetical protein